MSDGLSVPADHKNPNSKGRGSDIKAERYSTEKQEHPRMRRRNEDLDHPRSFDSTSESKSKGKSERLRWFGKDGPGGHWFIRVPLWLQSTILIFFIGFLSLLLLTVVSAVQVWSYTENLMQTRLSSLAGMTAIELEQTFKSLERSVNTVPTSETVINLLRASNNNMSLTPYWHTFNKENCVQLSFSDCLAMVLYDKRLKPVYTYRKRVSSDPFLGEQNNMLPKNLFPLSDPDLKDDMLANLNHNSGGVLANATVNSVFETTTSINLTYSVTMGIFSDLESDNLATNGQVKLNENINHNYIGYSTFVLESPVSSAVVSEQLFSRYIVEVVRLNDINLRNSYASSLKEGNFSFLYPFIAENGSVNYEQTWPVSSFPVLLDAVDLLVSTSRSKDSSLNSTHQIRINDTVNGIPDGIDDGFTNVISYETLRRKALPKLLFNYTMLKKGNSSERGAYSNSSTNIGQGNSTSALDSFIGGYGCSTLKTDAAEMRSSTPFNQKSSVGYSFANIYNQKWLVFVQIPESEAFTDARHVRNVVVAVGGGILGAVFLILLPLSRMQTQGFYVIYQNMKLRPLYFRAQDERHDFDGTRPVFAAIEPEAKGEYSEDAKKGNLAGLSSQASNASKIQLETGDESDGDQKYFRSANSSRIGIENNNIMETSSVLSALSITPSLNATSRDQTPGIKSLPRDTEQGRSDSEEHYGLNIPKPLPPLSRWFNDEVDDLIKEYNCMTEKLNAHSLHLEDQVRLRTLEAQKARELREQANAAKSEFIAIISHELRTPLNGIMGLTAVSVDEKDITKIRSALNIIIESGHILMDLLNELLELSKSLVGIDPIINEFTPIGLLEMLPNLFTSRTPSLSVSFAMAVVPAIAGNVKLRGDVEHIAQVCLNFMSNAMKFSEENGQVSVISHIRPLNDPLISLTRYGDSLKNANGILEILVTDSGVGISRAHLAKIFDLFVQGEDPLRKNRKGAGLGMALSKQLAEGIGGYVAVFSAKDVGTTTLIRAPVEVVGFTAEEVMALNGPHIEFKASDVYSTISLKSGEVSAVMNFKAPTPTITRNNTPEALQNLNNSPNTSQFSQRWHSQNPNQLSPGSPKILLARAHPVSKLLRAHTQHHHNKSVNSSKSQISRQSGSTEGTLDSALSNKANGGSTIPAVVSSHSNASASSLLLIVPEFIFNPNNPLRHQHSARLDSSSSKVPSPHALEDGGLRSCSSLLLPLNKNNQPRRHSPSLTITPQTMDTSAASHFMYQTASREHNIEPQTSKSDPPLRVFISSPQRSPSPSCSLDTDARVLVAEDNKINQNIMVKLLEQIGFKNVDVADNGNAVIKLVEKSIVEGYHYGVIFMDLSMPGINGIDATQIIRTTLGYPYPIIAWTGFSDIQTHNACLAVNIQEVITKPVMKNDILRVLQKYVSQTQISHPITIKDTSQTFIEPTFSDLIRSSTLRTL